LIVVGAGIRTVSAGAGFLPRSAAWFEVENAPTKATATKTPKLLNRTI